MNIKNKYPVIVIFTLIAFYFLSGCTSDKPVENDANTMEKQQKLRHVVLFKFKEGTSQADIKKVEGAFKALPAKIPQIKDFEWGTNNSPETHDDGFTHCFMVTFDSDEGRAAYLPHPEHGAFVDLLGPVLEDVRVLDFFAEK